MRFSISKTEFQNALAIAQKGISGKTTLPVLTGVLIQTQQDQVVFHTTQGDELSIKYSAPALVEEAGAIVVPCKLLGDIVKNLNDAAVHFHTASNCAYIECDTSSFMVKTIDADDFPEFPKVNALQSLTVSFNDFTSMVKKVAKVVAKDDSRPILSGVLVSLENGILKLVATDSYRLAMAEQELNIDPSITFNAIISGAFLLDVAALPKGEENINISLSDNQILVTYQNIIFINRRINGTFPNYKQVMAGNYTTKVKIKTEDFVSSVRRTALIGNIKSSVKVVVNPEEESVKLSAISQEIGSAEDSLTCKGEGEPVEIGFNSGYLLDGLTSISTEYTTIQFQGGMKPSIITSGEGEKFLFFIMPVKI